MRYSILWLIIILSISSCTKKPIQTAEVNLINTAEGTITLRSIGYGKTEKDAFVHAEKQAFEIILFRGIPRSQVENPLIENEGEARSKHAAYLDNFFTEQMYKTFIMSSYTTTAFGKDKLHGGRIALDIKINLFSLRKELEKNNLIRKFGF